jgi:hypothetical protein
MSERLHEILGQENPGPFERLGLILFHRMAAAADARDASADAGAPTLSPECADRLLNRAVRRALAFSLTLSFALGAASAGAAVFAELYFPETACDGGWLTRFCLIKYGTVAAIILVMTTLELAGLVLLAIRVVFRLAQITGHLPTARQRAESVDALDELFFESDAFARRIPNLLARAALEIPDPVRVVLGIDPLRHVSKRTLFLLATLYKMKILISNALAKMILRRVLGKSVLRVSVLYISVPITGLWNAIVTYRVAREARLRLFGNLMARHIVERAFTPTRLAGLSPRARLGCLQAVGNSIVLARSNHPNLILLLARLWDVLAPEIQSQENLDDWESFLTTLSALETDAPGERALLLNLLAVAAAFDGRISRLETARLGEAFGSESPAYFAWIRKLRDLLLAGRLHAARDESERWLGSSGALP